MRSFLQQPYFFVVCKDCLHRSVIFNSSKATTQFKDTVCSPWQCCRLSALQEEMINKCPAAGCTSCPSSRQWRASPGSWCGGSAPAETTWRQNSRWAINQPILPFSATRSCKQSEGRKDFRRVTVVPFTANRWSYNTDRPWNYVSSILEIFIVADSG